MNYPQFIIEHLEPKLWKWCLIEYEQMSKIVGKNNLIFTNIKNNSKYLEKFGKVKKQSVKKMILKNVCILDPEAEKTLTTKEAKQFKYFILGGILGDNPPRKRTEEELTPFVNNGIVRNIGKKQLSTDNAVYVTWKIYNGTPLNKIKFKDEIEIKINETESTILPYSYPVINDKPLISKKLVEYLKKH